MGGPDMGGLILLGACNGGPGIVHRIDRWQTGNRKAPWQSHLPLCFPANSTPILA